MVVIELLTVRAWFQHVIPQLWRRRKAGEPVGPCVYIDASRFAPPVARLTRWLAGMTPARLDFRLVDVRDEDGQLIRLRIAYRDLAEVQSDVVEGAAFQQRLRQYDETSRFGAFVVKSVATVSLSDRTTLWRALLLIQIARWKHRELGVPGRPTLIMERRAWIGAIQRYAARAGVETRIVPPAIQVRQRLRQFGKHVHVLRRVRDRVLHWWSVGRATSAPAAPTDATPTPAARIAVQYHGQFNLDDRSRYSDLFFWQESDLAGRDVLVLFPLPQDPLDADKLAQLEAHEIGAVGIYPGAVSVPGVPMYSPAPAPRLAPAATSLDRSAWSGSELTWLRQTERDYEYQRGFWEGLFRQQGAKLYTTWQRFDAQHFAIADAMTAVGGATAIYQRAYQPDPSPEIAVNADLMFGYAPADAEVERRSGSVIGHHVAVGYFGDHRFPLLREPAAAMRAATRAAGAEFIVAFFDENSAPDSRWHTGHEFMRENYAFLLEQLLSQPWMGLLLKPKFPGTLRKRLGPVAPLLERAIATGRCHLHEAGTVNGAHPPAAAAMAADVAIHGHLCAATAGLEAALAGVPTLLLDREGWPMGRPHALGPAVAFTDWPTLWHALLDARRRRDVRAGGFGDWTPLLDEMDPFRDGRGAWRMGWYLTRVLQGLQAGEDRLSVLTRVADGYAAAWGADKITRVTG